MSGFVTGTSLPVHSLTLTYAFINNKVLVGVSEKLLTDGVDMLVRNHLVGSVLSDFQLLAIFC